MECEHLGNEWASLQRDLERQVGELESAPRWLVELWVEKVHLIKQRSSETGRHSQLLSKHFELTRSVQRWKVLV